MPTSWSATASDVGQPGRSPGADADDSTTVLVLRSPASVSVYSFIGTLTYCLNHTASHVSKLLITFQQYLPPLLKRIRCITLESLGHGSSQLSSLSVNRMSFIDSLPQIRHTLRDASLIN